MVIFQPIFTLIFSAFFTNAIASTIYVAARNHLFISHDDGRNWESNPQADIDCGHDVYTVFATKSQIYVAGIDISVGMHGCLSTSTDGGKTWKKHTTFPKMDAANAVFAVGIQIYVGTSSGLAMSADDGQTWIMKTTTDGLPYTFVRQVFVEGGNVYVACDNGDLISPEAGFAVSIEGGKSFVSKTKAEISEIHSMRVVNRSVILLGTNAGLAMTVDGGQTWRTMDEKNGLGTKACKQVFGVDMVNNTIFASAGCADQLEFGLYINPDFTSQKFHRVNDTGLSRYAAGDVVIKTGGGRKKPEVYVQIVKGDLLAISKDAGSTWTTVKNPLGTPAESSWDIFVIDP